jgi:branched-chain amino acid transport system ATP-binding protein
MPVIRDLNLAIREGEIVALLGANGAGKTTLLLGLAGVLRPGGGVVRFEGLAVPAKRPLHKRAAQGLAFVPEGRSVFMQLTCEENLRLGRGSVEAATELMPELKALLKRRAGLLSGGEQQMVSLGRALASQPKVLLVDELSLGLAPIIVNRLFDAIRRAADAGVGVMLVEQNARVALTNCQRGIVLSRGEVVMEGSSDDLSARLPTIERTYLSSLVTGE